MRVSTQLASTLLVTAILIALSACSLRYDFTECESDGDCHRIENPTEGEYYQCVANECVLEQDRQCRVHSDCPGSDTCEQGRCQTIEPPEDAGGDADADAVGDADTGSADADAADVDDEPDAPQTSCATTQECIDRFDASYYCAPAGECVDTTHAACDEIYYPNNSRDHIILLGSIVPTEGAFTALGTTIKNAVRLAVIEYARNAFDLPSGHTVAHLQCQGGSSEASLAAAAHMKQIGVPVVVGPLTSSNFIDVVRNISAADPGAPMGTIALGATSPALGNLDAAGKHAFQIIPNDRFQTSAVVDRLSELRWRSCVQQAGDDECTDEAACQQAFGPDYVFDDTNTEAPCKDDDAKVAVFYKDDQYGNDFQSLLLSRFGDRHTEASVEYFQYANPAELDFDPLRIQQEFGSVINQALQGNNAMPDADLVVFVGTSEATLLAKAYIGALLNQDPTLALSKRYVFSHGAAADVPDMFVGDDSLPASVIPLVEAVAPDIFNEPYYTKWQGRYSVTFNEPAQTSVGAIAYDAAFLSIFAMAAVDSGDAIDGANVTSVIEDARLQDKSDDAFEIILEEDTSFPGEARQALRDGKNIDMVGVSGGLDFVIESGTNRGTVRSNYLGFDIDQSGSGNYFISPTRIYILEDGENFGAWMPIPPQQN